MTVIRQEDFIASVARRAAVHQLLPPGGLHHQPGSGLRERAVPCRQGRHGADPHQQPHVRRGPPAHLPGHGHRQCLRQGRHGRALRGGSRRRSHSTCRRWSTKACAAPISILTTSCAPRSRPTRRARAKTPKTTRPPPSPSNWSTAIRSTSPSRPRAAGPKPKASSSCSIPPIPSWSGCSKPCPPWAPDGARPACSASASAARRRKPCCWPSSR